MKNITTDVQMPQKEEAEFARLHRNDTDAELFTYLKELKAKHGKRLNPTNTIGYTYFIKRLGLWNVVMKQISDELNNQKEM